MARHSRLLIPALFAAALPAVGQSPDHPKNEDGGPGHPGPGQHHGGPMSPEFENVRKALEALTPDQRKRFQENFQRWSNLPPEQKKALQDHDEFRRKRIAEDIDAAIRESGLELDKDRREQFMKRYGEERRKVEEQLRKEWDEKRKPLLAEIVGRLKKEFSAPASANP